MCRPFLLGSFKAAVSLEHSEQLRLEIPLGMLWEVGSLPGNITPSGQLTKTNPDDAKWGSICFQGKSLPDPHN